jgi:hypothetical protein
MKNYKAHFILSCFKPLLQGNSPTSSVFVLKKKNIVTIGKCSCVMIVPPV